MISPCHDCGVELYDPHADYQRHPRCRVCLTGLCPRCVTRDGRCQGCAAPKEAPKTTVRTRFEEWLALLGDVPLAAELRKAAEGASDTEIAALSWRAFDAVQEKERADELRRLQARRPASRRRARR